MTLNFDSLTHISTHCDFQTRVRLKTSCKTLNKRIQIELLKDETVINKEFVGNSDNSWIFFEYFRRTFITPHQFDKPEPYLVDYTPEPGIGTVLFVSSPYDVFYQQEIKNKEERFRSHVTSQEVKFFGELKYWFDCDSDSDEDGEEFVESYTANELWYKILEQSFDYDNPNCVGYKLNPTSPRIQGFKYVGKYCDFNEDCIDYEY